VNDSERLDKYDNSCIAVCGWWCSSVSAWQAKRKYYEKSQQSDTLDMTLKDAHTLKSTYAPRKWDNVCCFLPTYLISASLFYLFLFLFDYFLFIVFYVGYIGTLSAVCLLVLLVTLISDECVFSAHFYDTAGHRAGNCWCDENSRMKWTVCSYTTVRCFVHFLYPFTIS